MQWPENVANNFLHFQLSPVLERTSLDGCLTDLLKFSLPFLSSPLLCLSPCFVLSTCLPLHQNPGNILEGQHQVLDSLYVSGGGLSSSYSSELSISETNELFFFFLMWGRT